jgi:hypothetical protein
MDDEEPHGMGQDPEAAGGLVQTVGQGVFHCAHLNMIILAYYNLSIDLGKKVEKISLPPCSPEFGV